MFSYLLYISTISYIYISYILYQGLLLRENNYMVISQPANSDNVTILQAIKHKNKSTKRPLRHVRNIRMVS